MSLVTEQDHFHETPLDQLTPLEFAQVMARANLMAAEAVAAVSEQVARGIELFVSVLEAGGQIYLFGAGTSGRLAVLEAAECPPTFDTPPDMIQAVIAGGAGAMTHAIEGAEDDALAGEKAVSELPEGSLIVGISASGRAPFVRGALQEARRRSLPSLLITSQPGLEALAGAIISPATGPEVLAGSTRLKAATAAKCVLNALTTGSMAALGRVYGSWMVEVRPTNAKLRERASSLIERFGKVDPATASELLESSAGDVKEAIVRARCECSAEEARARLKACKRRLREIIE